MRRVREVPRDLASTGCVQNERVSDEITILVQGLASRTYRFILVRCSARCNATDHTAAARVFATLGRRVFLIH